MKLKIAILSGDGIGPEIMKQGVAVLDAIAKKCGLAPVPLMLVAMPILTVPTMSVCVLMQYSLLLLVT